MHSRMERVNELLLSEIARLLLREVKDPRIGFVSLTHVETSKDLGHARVRVSVLGSEEQKEQTLRGLNSAAGFIRGALAKELRLRNIPLLHFVLDDSIERAAHLTHVLHELQGQATSHPESPDTLPDDATVDEDEAGAID